MTNHLYSINHHNNGGANNSPMTCLLSSTIPMTNIHWAMARSFLSTHKIPINLPMLLSVAPESIVIPIVSCIFGFPVLALLVICCLRKRAKMARERDRRRNYDLQDHTVSLVRFSPIHRLSKFHRFFLLFKRGLQNPPVFNQQPLTFQKEPLSYRSQSHPINFRVSCTFYLPGFKLDVPNAP